MRWVIPVRRKLFESRDGFRAVLEYCQRDAAATELVRVNSASDLLIHPVAFKTPGGYRFNATAYRETAALICGGLPSVIFALSSAAPAGGADSVTKALIGIHNQAVKLAGHSLEGFRLVVDKRDQAIVGIVGRNYKFVANAELLSTVANYFRQATSSHALLRAEIRNRELFLLASRNGWELSSEGVSFRQGLAMFNSETTKRAIYVPRVLFDSSTKGYAFESESGVNRMIHRRKKKFAVQLEGMLTAAFQAGSFLEDMTRRFKECRKRPLCRVDKRQEVLQSISRRLVDRKINVQPAERVVQLLSQHSEPSHWEVYRAIVCAASEFRSTERHLRMAAFRFLVEGKL